MVVFTGYLAHFRLFRARFTGLALDGETMKGSF